MSDDTAVFSCTHCGTKYRGPATAQKVRCAKCKNVVERTLSTAAPSIPKSATSRSQSSIAPAKSVQIPTPQPSKLKQLGFFGYCWRSYSDTHSILPWFFGVIVGLILIPALSFSKPLIGHTGMWFAFGGASVAGFILFMFLWTVASLKYLFARQQQIPEGHATWLSTMTCFLLTLSPLLGTVAAIESIAPPKGLLVTLIPQLEKEQIQLLPHVKQNSPETDLASTSEKDAPVPTIPDTTNKSDEISNSESPKRKTTDPSADIAQVDHSTQQNSSSQSAEDSSVQKKPKSAGSTSNGKTQEVIAEGVGATADEAIKDAYRNAVRQVVGAVVDAETLVKNDEIVDDKVLTYSDGFIESYEEIDGSKKVKRGLHRIKIKAQVERRSVIAKLKAANVTVKEVDGKGLFAEAVTQLDAEKDAAALLKKQFEGFPQSCITVTIIGKPELVSKTGENATVKITVQIEPDLKAYKAFVEKLIPTLEKVAKDKGEFTAKYAKQFGDAAGELHAIHNGIRGGDWDLMETWMPKVFIEGRGQEREMSIAIATNRTNSAESIDYKYYAVDPSLEPVLKAVSLRAGECKLRLLDADGEIIVTDRFKPVEDSPSHDSFYGSPVARVEVDASGKKLLNLMVSPVFGNTDEDGYGRNRRVDKLKTTLNFLRTITLSLEELKTVKDAKIEITFDE